MVTSPVISLMLVVLLSLATAHTSSMNVPSVLLPYPTKEHPIEYTIEATNGCFRWTTSNPTIATLRPLGDQCSNKCIISVSTVEKKHKQSFWVYATDEVQHINLRTEVVIDSIEHIEILTTTRLMNKDDYEVLEVAGFDSVGNKFSTLEGIPVVWSIESVNGTKGSGGDYVRIEKFSAAGTALKIKASKTVLDMERTGYTTSKILVKGLELGKARMTAQVMDEPMKRSSVVLTVLQILVVLPEKDVYVLPKTEIPYTVYTTKRNELGAQIKMPNRNYKWESYIPRVATVDNSGKAIAKDHGSSEISVMYVETPESIQKRRINVVKPYKVRLVWKEIHGTWQWIEGRQYEVTPEVLDINGNTISYITNPGFKVQINNALSLVSHAQGFTSFVVKAKDIGHTTISVVFVQGNGMTVRGGSVSCDQDIIISPQVVASPKSLRITVPGTAGCRIMAVGGQGEYVYTIDGESVAVTNDGIVFPRLTGTSVVTVTDSRNSENFDSVIVEALEVASIEITNPVSESKVGGLLNFTATAKDAEGRYFDVCSSASVNWKVMQPDIFELQTNVTSPSASIKALKSGSSTLVATYGKGIAEVQIFAFDQLQLHSKVNRSPHVAKASGFQISFEGGPIPWYLNKNLYFTRFAMTKKIAEVQNLGNNELLIVCKEYGKASVKVEVGNKQGTSHNYTVSSSAFIEFECSEPSVLMLTTQDVYESDHDGVEIHRKNIPSICKERAVTNDDGVHSEMTVRIGEELDLIGYVKPSVTGMFTNSSSVEYQWSSSDRKLVDIYAPVKGVDHSTVHISVGDKIGKVEVRLTAVRYQRPYFEKIGLSYRHVDINDRLVRTITLNIVDVVHVHPNAVTLFNHPQNYVTITATSGSGFYNFTTDTPYSISLEHYGTDASCTVRPLNETNTYVVVSDVCFNGKSDEARVAVTVSDVHSINVMVTDQIEVGDSEILKFEAIDVNGVPFDDSQYKYMDVHVTADNSNVFIEKKSIKEYVITGSSIGTAMITVTINKVRSKPSNVIVYEHFMCAPKEINLIPLAQEDIKCRGGPPLRSTVRHTIISGSSVTLNGDKVVGEKKGRSVVESSISYIDLLSGEKRDKGRETCDVVVRHLTGLRMEAHQTTLEVGGQTKLRVIGEAEGVPVSIASTQLDFAWSQSDELPLSILSVYHDSNVTANDEMSHTVLLVAKNAGQTRITVKVVNIQKGLPASYKTLTASLLIHTIDPFTSFCAGKCRNVIDMALHSSTQITTNREPSRVTFEICEGQNIVSVDSTGIVTSKGVPGSAVVHAIETETGEMLSYVVKVHRIHAIELLPIETTSGISVGETMKFEIIPIGDRGRVLRHSYNKLVKFDVIPTGSATVVQSGNVSIIEVIAAKPGRTIVRVMSNEVSRIQDEVRVTIHHSVSPINPVVPVGAEIKFSTAGDATWTSEVRGIVSVSSDGKAYARSIGRTTIMTTSATPAQTRVTVSPLESVSLEPATVGAGRVLIPITMYSDAGIITQGNNIDLNLNAYCSIEQSGWAQAEVEVVDGKWYCSVVAIPTVSSMAPSSIKLRFVAKDMSGKSIQTVVNLPFKAGIVSRPGTLQMNVGKEVRLDIFRAQGDVVIRDTTNKLQIREITRGDGTASFTIRGMEQVNGIIEVYDGVETLKVAVNVGEMKKSRGVRSSANALGPIFIALVAIAIASLVFVLCRRRSVQMRPYGNMYNANLPNYYGGNDYYRNVPQQQLYRFQ